VKNFLLIILILCSSSKIFALDDQDPGDLAFLHGQDEYMLIDKETTKYTPLTHFRVNEKYCLHGSEHWGEACQDEAMKFAFTSACVYEEDLWKNEKQVLLKFIEFVHNEDIEGIIELCELPVKIGNHNHDQLRKFIKELLHYRNGILKNISYEGLIINGHGSSSCFESIGIGTYNKKIFDFTFFNY